MRVTSGSRLRVRLESLLFVLLFLGVLGVSAWLSTRYHLQMDWTASGRNTLSEASRLLLTRMPEAITVTAYARQNEVTRKPIAELVERYRRHKGDIQFRFVDPDTVPDEVRRQGITLDGEMLLVYQGRTEHLQSVNEQDFTNTLQRLARAGERWVVFIDGHGERKPLGSANHDLGNFGRQLEKRGLTLQSIKLADQDIPTNTTVLVLAGPQVELLPGEVQKLQTYLAEGHNLLWLLDPDGLHGLEPLAADLGLNLTEGVVVDAATRLFGIEHPAMALVTEYPLHPVTEQFDLVTVFPHSAGLRVQAPEGWQADTLLTTGDTAWSETGELNGEIRFDADRDGAGPLDIAVSLTRNPDPPGEGEANAGLARSQRVILVGDGDFLSNAYLGNGGNLDLGFNMINWLASDEELIDIPAKTAPDLSLELSRSASIIIGLGSLLVLPSLLLGMGGTIWWRRRRR